MKQEIQRQPSLPYLYSEIQGFMAALLQREGMALTTLITRLPAAELEAGRKGFLDPKQDRVVTTYGFCSTFRNWAADQT